MFCRFKPSKDSSFISFKEKLTEDGTIHRGIGPSLGFYQIFSNLHFYFYKSKGKKEVLKRPQEERETYNENTKDIQKLRLEGRDSKIEDEASFL